jgi:COMPASS component SWD1
MVAIGAGQFRRKSQGPESEFAEEDEDSMPANGQTKRRRGD